MAWTQIINNVRAFPLSTAPGFSRLFSSESPTPYIVKVGILEFLNGIGKGVETHVPKLESDIGNFQKLLVTRTLKLKKLCIPCKHVYRCLSQEKRRPSHYLHPRTAEMLLQIVKNQLLEQRANKLFEKKEAENSVITQEILSKCAAMTPEWGSSVSTTEEWLGSLMASSTNKCRVRD